MYYLCKDQDSEVFPIGHGNDAFLLPYDLPLSPYKKDGEYYTCI